MIILKIIFLFLMVFFSLINICKMVAKDRIPAANFFWQAVGITGFIFMQMKGW